MNNIFENDKKAWVVAVDMGYGHQRTAYPLRGLSPDGRVINANHYKEIPLSDKNFWSSTKYFYEFISRFRAIPIIGLIIFLFFDSFQRILRYYPKRDLSKPNLTGKIIFSAIKKGRGIDLIERLKSNPLPIVTTFFTPAFMAEELNYPNDIYCVICDADVSRAWVSLNPKKSRIKYFVPNSWVRDRLKLYGVKTQNIIFTGYPLPKENIGGENMDILKKDLGYRILNLDPNGKYQKLYRPLIKSYVGELPKMPSHPLTIMFSIGGAGAQKEIAVQIINSLAKKIKEKKIRFIISVGLRDNLREYIQNHIDGLKLDGWVHILSGKNMEDYFSKFNQALRTTDILMTKPSELSFYTGLGIPIIIQPSIGSQEDFNRNWLLHIGSGVLQENPKYTDEWLLDLLDSGDLAEMAMQGFVETKALGTYNIEKIIKESQSSIHGYN